MELKTLFLGILFALGAFAVKSGMGGYYFLAKRNRPRYKAIYFFVHGLVYFLVFGLSAVTVRAADLVSKFQLIQGLLQWGMTVHFLFAAGLAVWGTMLLRRRPESTRESLGWLALVVPCPICLTVIFFSVAFLVSFFPKTAYLATLAAFFGFWVVHLLTVMVLSWGTRQVEADPETALGTGMVLLSLYFVLSVVIMPHFGQLDRIYRLSIHSQQNTSPASQSSLLVYLGMAVVFIGGFFATKLKTKGA